MGPIWERLGIVLSPPDANIHSSVVLCLNFPSNTSNSETVLFHVAILDFCRLIEVGVAKIFPLHIKNKTMDSGGT